MTRNELIAIAGKSNVDALEALNCEPTSRNTSGTADHGYAEYVASLEIEDGRTITAVYYQTIEDSKQFADFELDWDVDHYTID